MRYSADFPEYPESVMPKQFLRSFSATHIGKVREVNEDALICRDEAGLWGVADGIGGHDAGDLASQAVRRHLQEVGDAADLDALVDQTRAALYQANEELLDLRSHISSPRSPGSTVAVLLIRDNQGAVVWAGDSRVYRLRAGKLKLITHDHSHVQDLVDRGELEPEEAKSHPMANYITRAVGTSETLNLDTFWFEVEQNDRFLLCTDGLSGLLSNGELFELAAAGQAGERVQNMIDAALARGAPDNVTLIMVEVN